MSSRNPRLTGLAFYPYAHKLVTTSFNPDKCRPLRRTTKLVLSVVTSIKIPEDRDTDGLLTGGYPMVNRVSRFFLTISIFAQPQDGCFNR